MGNTIIMLAVVVAVLRHLQVTFDVLVDGDNALVFLRGGDSERVVRCFAPLALSFSGHEMVLENPVRVLEHVRFGQSAPVELSPGRWHMVRDWTKVISQMTSNHAHLRELPFVGPYLRGVAQCELSLHVGVPVAQAFAARLIHVTEGSRAVNEHFYRDYQSLRVDIARRVEAKFVEPTTLARESFSRAFGLDPDAQLEVERHLSGLSMVLRPWREEESPWVDELLSSRPGLVDQFYGVSQ